MRFIPFLIALLLSLPPSPAQAEPHRGLKAENANRKNRPAVISSPVRAGTKALQFQLRDGQCAGNRHYDDCKGGRERSEIVDRSRVKPGEEHWYALSIFLPQSTPHIDPSGTILAQWQDTKGSGEITLALEMWAEGLQLTQDDPATQQVDDMAPPRPMVIKTLIPDSRLRGRWHDFRIRAVWSTGADGRIQVWLGDRLVHQHKGRNLNRNAAPTFKFGLYRSGLDRYRSRHGAVPTQVVIFDEVAHGRSAAEVALP